MDNLSDESVTFCRDCKGLIGFDFYASVLKPFIYKGLLMCGIRSANGMVIINQSKTFNK